MNVFRAPVANILPPSSAEVIHRFERGRDLVRVTVPSTISSVALDPENRP
ncbi:hypothetical protein [Halorussus salinisoli]|nr:hypothetical protein [Halorussus salinisoli]